MENAGSAMTGQNEADPMRSDLSRQASAWLVRLEGEPDNEALHVQFIDWLATSPAHLAAWEETTHVYGLMTAVGPMCASTSPALSKHRARLPKLGRAGTFSALVLTACFAWFVAPDLALRVRSDEVTRTAELRVVRLQDGSTVHLAPLTAIAFTEDAKGRRLDLLQGEAWFDVAHDKARPFRVVVGDNRVTVLGTAFSVDKIGRNAAVAVQRGRVAVEMLDPASPHRVVLVAGQSVWMGEGTPAPSTIRPDRIAAWREGVAIVNDQPIGDVIDLLRPWYKGYIVTRGPGLPGRRVSGVFDLRDPDLALEALARAHKMTVARVSPWLRIVTVG